MELAVLVLMVLMVLILMMWGGEATMPGLLINTIVGFGCDCASLDECASLLSGPQPRRGPV